MPLKIIDIVGTDYQPIASSNFARRTGQWLILVEFWVVTTLCIFTNYYFYLYAYQSNPWLFLMLPLSLWGLVYQFAFLTALLTWFFLVILRKIEPPKEGEFPLDGREFKYYCYRFYICYYTLYLFRGLALPWADMIAFRLFGMKVGGSVVLYDSWVDPELVEIGDNVMLSMNAALISHCIYNKKFVVGKVVVGRNAIVGAEAVVGPGAILEDGAILGVGCHCRINQRLDAYSTHVGNPASKVLPIKIVDDEPKGGRK
jgi:acetyltransferase-like isoleucine patch superfamily enzyme